eukprot:gene9893-13307_t
MGKNWKHTNINKDNLKGSSNDVSSCRNHSVVIGTCDVARERESTKELMNIINVAIEEEDKRNPVKVSGPSVSTDVDVNIDPVPFNNVSIKDLLQSEIQEVRQQRHVANKDVVSINVGIQGLVLVKIMRSDLCVVKLVKSVFDKIRISKLPCCRHLVRLIPLQKVFFPNEEEFVSYSSQIIQEKWTCELQNEFITCDTILTTSPNANIKRGVNELLNGNDEVDDCSILANNKRVKIEDSNEGTSDHNNNSSQKNEISVALDDVWHTNTEIIQIPIIESENKVFYSILFKARNNNSLLKSTVHNELFKRMPLFCKPSVDMKKVKAVVIVEALKSLCGVSLFTNFSNYYELNLRKFQNQFTVEVDNRNKHMTVQSQTATSHIVE